LHLEYSHLSEFCPNVTPCCILRTVAKYIWNYEISVVKSVKFLQIYSLPLLPSRYTYEIKLLEYTHVNSRNTHHVDWG